MKSKFNIILQLLICIIVLMYCISCSDNDSPNITPTKIDTLMPAYTDTGANVAAFKINGRKVIAEDKLRRSRSITLLITKNVDSPYAILYLVAAYQSLPWYEGISFSIDNFVDTGYYYLNDQNEYNPNGGQYLVGKADIPLIRFHTTDEYSGWVHIKKYDREKKILSGTFEFQALDLYGWYGNVSITDGIFDATYY